MLRFPVAAGNQKWSSFSLQAHQTIIWKWKLHLSQSITSICCSSSNISRLETLIGLHDGIFFSLLAPDSSTLMRHRSGLICLSSLLAPHLGSLSQSPISTSPCSLLFVVIAKAEDITQAPSNHVLLTLVKHLNYNVSLQNCHLGVSVCSLQDKCTYTILIQTSWVLTRVINLISLFAHIWYTHTHTHSVKLSQRWAALW